MFNTITLEMSLRPFKKTESEYIRNVCKNVFTSWYPLLKNRKNISIMLWTGDGSEILDYNGDMDKTFEWGYFLGTANLPLASESDDAGLNLHTKTRYYMDNPPKMTYGILKSIINTLKEEGKKAFPNANITIGETFDIGPEFAKSDFKYKRHPEICAGARFENFGFVDSTALLNADDYSYKAYPNGIPQGLPFATFFGKQIKEFFNDVGFDYIWLSNGLGFSADPWSLTGKIFDGEKFYADKLERTSNKVFAFWELFRKACADIPVLTRGTNNSVGIDYATDGVPLWDIYNANFNIMPPPNSPWAALNDNYGLEIMGHMTRICELPGNEFLFRYYIHDPWWLNSPWQDRYDGCPTDIYLPMTVARIIDDGKVQTASRFHILSIDNSWGDMPDNCVNEPLPHILKAEKHSPDEPSFLLWLYPMKEYTTSKNENDLRDMYYGDKFIMEGINQGFPLNTVISTEIFKKVSQNVYNDRIIVAPIIKDEEINALLLDYAKKGGKIILYGSANSLNRTLIDGENVVKVDILSLPSCLRESLNKFDYCIEFETLQGYLKLPTITINRNNNAMMFSVYNPDTTTDTLLKFPLGAPILLGGETQIINGKAKYRFSRCEHRECRVFVKQDNGIVSMHEEPPVNAKYRRRIAIKGLNNATVYYFPETHANTQIMATKKSWAETPELEDGWVPYYDEVMGLGFMAENRNGKLAFLIPYEKYV